MIENINYTDKFYFHDLLVPSSPWVSFCPTSLTDRRLSFSMGASCFCPGVPGPPSYCRERGVNRHPQDQDDFLSQAQAPSPGLQEEAEGLGGEEGQKGSEDVGTLDGRKLSVDPR